MLKIYGTWLCPNCRAAEQKLKADGVEFEFIDIFNSTANMKEFLGIRDHSDIYEDVKAAGGIGIPTFIKEDGSPTRSLEEALGK